MATVQLEIPESQVLTLVQQLSPEGKQRVWQMLLVEIGDASLEWEDAADDQAWAEDTWEGEGFMTRQQLLAAETFNYSYANYDNHLGIGNVRFDRLMPNDVDALEQAEREDWNDAKLAEALEVDELQVPDWRESYRRAKLVVDAPTPAESFRRGVRFSVRDALEKQGKGELTGEKLVERIVGQVCYRAADLAYMLDMLGERLPRYSRELRKEPGVDYPSPEGD